MPSLIKLAPGAPADRILRLLSAAPAAIVLAFTVDDVAGASYGDPKIGYTMDKIIEAICDGRIPVRLEGAGMDIKK